jgi:hypothetical protein
MNEIGHLPHVFSLSLGRRLPRVRGSGRKEPLAAGRWALQWTKVPDSAEASFGTQCGVATVPPARSAPVATGSPAMPASDLAIPLDGNGSDWPGT